MRSILAEVTTHTRLLESSILSDRLLYKVKKINKMRSILAEVTTHTRLLESSILSDRLIMDINLFRDLNFINFLKDYKYIKNEYKDEGFCVIFEESEYELPSNRTVLNIKIQTSLTELNIKYEKK
jgi:hypothetical protein